MTKSPKPRSARQKNVLAHTDWCLRLTRLMGIACVICYGCPSVQALAAETLGLINLNMTRTQGEIEAAVCEGMSRFEQEYMGRGPKNIHAHLIDDLVVVRLRGVLTAAEQHLVKSLPAEKGRDLLKQVRTHLIETARPLMEAMIEEITGEKVTSLHHDISTMTGEELVAFSLARAPAVREVRKGS